jgi:GT2 family glycosyltransferase
MAQAASDALPSIQIACLIVTYGDRWQYLSQVVTACLGSNHTAAVVILDNASTYDVASEVQNLQDSDRVKVIRSDRNTGSAGGYNQVIAFGQTLDNIDYYLMLDDDNVPQKDTIERLCLYAAASSTNALMCVRPDREELVYAANNSTGLALKKNSFLGFSIRSILREHLRLQGNSTSAQSNLEYAPYGGLFVSREALISTQLPLKDYFLYVDDHEYSSRIAANFGGIKIVRDAVVIDVERSWNLPKANSIPPLFDPNSSEIRAYYGTRNRAHFEKQSLINSNSEYFLNMFLYTAWLLIKSFRHGLLPKQAVRRLRLLKTAVTNGRNGHLGEIQSINSVMSQGTSSHA